MQIKRTGLNSEKIPSDNSYRKLKYKIISQFDKTNKQNDFKCTRVRKDKMCKSISGCFFNLLIFCDIKKFKKSFQQVKQGQGGTENTVDILGGVVTFYSSLFQCWFSLFSQC